MCPSSYLPCWGNTEPQHHRLTLELNQEGGSQSTMVRFFIAKPQSETSLQLDPLSAFLGQCNLKSVAGFLSMALSECYEGGLEDGVSTINDVW